MLLRSGCCRIAARHQEHMQPFTYLDVSDPGAIASYSIGCRLVSTILTDYDREKPSGRPMPIRY